MNPKELSLLLQREEFKILSSWQKQLFIRYCSMYGKEQLTGAVLASCCIKFNTRYTLSRFSQEFINWLRLY